MAPPQLQNPSPECPLVFPQPWPLYNLPSLLHTHEQVRTKRTHLHTHTHTCMCTPVIPPFRLYLRGTGPKRVQFLSWSLHHQCSLGQRTRQPSLVPLGSLMSQEDVEKLRVLTASAEVAGAAVSTKMQQPTSLKSGAETETNCHSTCSIELYLKLPTLSKLVRILMQPCLRNVYGGWLQTSCHPCPWLAWHPVIPHGSFYSGSPHHGTEAS